MGRTDFAEPVPGGLRLHVRLTPRSATDAIEGIGEAGGSGRVLVARVRAVPENGRANAALLKLLAQAGGWPTSALVLQAGSKSRVKRVAVSGDPAGLAEGVLRLRAAAGETMSA